MTATAANPTGAQTIIAASYERVSTRNQGRYGFSLGAQHQSLEDFVRAHDGWVLPEHLRFRDGEDADASGADWDLPDLTRMLEAARRREFHVLVVPDFDRFARSLVKGLVLEEQLKKYGVRVVYQRVPVEDTPEGRLLKNQLFSFAEYEREKFALRSLMGRRQKARTGQVVGGGLPPYGYRFTFETLDNGKRRIYGLEPDPITGPIARRILLALRSRSALDVAAELNLEGIPAPRSRRWSDRAVWYISIDPVYAGTWLFGRRRGRIVPEEQTGIPVTVPAIVSRQEWDEAQQAFAHRRRAHRGRLPREDDPYLLRGLLTCGHCRGLLQSRPNSGIRYYGCGCHFPNLARKYGKPVCALPDIHAPDLEAELWRVLDATLLDPDYLATGLEAARTQHDQADGLRRDRLTVLDEEIARQRHRLDNLTAQLADAGSGEVYASIMRRAKDIEAMIARLTGERAGLAAVRAEGLSAEEADGITAFAAEVRRGMANATPADRGRLYETLRIRGTVSQAPADDPDAASLGRKHRYRIDWDAAIPLRYATRTAP